MPTGNFGNILSAYFAKEMGLPIKTLVCASNANNVLTDFIRDGAYDRNRKFFNTMSPSMDILVSSNLERLLYLLSGRDATFVGECMAALTDTGRYRIGEELHAQLTREFYGGYCDDQRTSQVIGQVFREKHYLLDPHTAVAWAVAGDYRRKTGDRTPMVVASTASPFKFCDNVLKSLGEELPGEPGLKLLDRLEQVSGARCPQPLRELRGLPVRFEQVVERDGMAHAVLGLLKL